jgi:SWI/SNF-related matrix-associated actin-dependent regulator 1 of chromatin subfamily A
MITNEEIEKLATWSKAKEVQTKNGPRMLRKAAVTEAFSAAWKTRKEELKTAGASFTKNNQTGEWELAWWMQIDEATKAKRAESISLSRATAADVELPHPEGMDYMPFQEAGILYALDRKGVLIGDEMGLGKTIMAIGIINADTQADSVIIVCPKSLKLNWQRELERWLTKPLTVGVANGTWPDTQIVVASYENIKKYAAQIAERMWSICIVDEAHYIKSKTAQRTKAVKAIKAARHVRMTGTPIVNRPAELQSIIEDLEPSFAGFGFLKRYCNAHHNGFGWDFSGAANLDELQKRLRETIMVRRLKADVLTELPRKIRQVVELEPETAAQRKAVRAEQDYESDNDERLAELRAAVELSKAEGEDTYAAAVERLKQASQIAFTEMSRVRHETAVAKLPLIIDHIKATLEDDDDRKLIVAAHHHDVIDGIMDAAAENGWKPVKITGQNSAEERQAAVDAFQNDPTARVFVASIQAAGVGITLTAASHVIFAELDWTPGNISQMEDRAHRIGQIETVLVQHLVIAGSIDARMARTIISKQAVIESALDTNHPERMTPAYEPKETAATTETKPSDLDQITLTDGQIAAVHTCLRMLAGMDTDHAAEKNGVGYNKADVRIGHSLAERTSLTTRQAALGQKLCRKYHRQLPDDLLEIINASAE